MAGNVTEATARATPVLVPVKKLIAIRLPDDLLERIDAHRARMRQLTGGMEPTRSETIKFLLKHALDAIEDEKPTRKR